MLAYWKVLLGIPIGIILAVVGGVLNIGMIMILGIAITLVTGTVLRLGYSWDDARPMGMNERQKTIDPFDYSKLGANETK